MPRDLPTDGGPSTTVTRLDLKLSNVLTCRKGWINAVINGDHPSVFSPLFRINYIIPVDRITEAHSIVLYNGDISSLNLRQRFESETKIDILSYWHKAQDLLKIICHRNTAEKIVKRNSLKFCGSSGDLNTFTSSVLFHNLF